MPEGGRVGPGVTFWVPRVWVSPLREGNGIIEKPWCLLMKVAEGGHRRWPWSGETGDEGGKVEERERREGRRRAESVFGGFRGGRGGAPGGKHRCA